MIVDKKDDFFIRVIKAQKEEVMQYQRGKEDSRYKYKTANV